MSEENVGTNIENDITVEQEKRLPIVTIFIGDVVEDPNMYWNGERGIWAMNEFRERVLLSPLEANLFYSAHNIPVYDSQGIKLGHFYNFNSGQEAVGKSSQTFIHRLRQKIVHLFSGKEIFENIHGRGYRLHLDIEIDGSKVDMQELLDIQLKLFLRYYHQDKV